MVDRKSAIRNLVIFAAAAVSAGWIGHGLDIVAGGPPGERPGQLLWIVGPLLTALLLRGFAGDGWADSGLRPGLARNAAWYLFSISLFPICVAVTLLAGKVSGMISLADLSSGGIGHFLYLVSLALIPSFIKNIFEEFAWRGYLAPRISSIGVPDLAGHLLVGLVWAAWHIPYYLFFLDRSSLAAYSPLGLPLFIAMMFAGVVPLSFVYGELRMLTGSVWPVVLLHTVSNAVADPLFLHGYLRIAPEADILLSPGPGSVISIVLNAAIGLWLYRCRTIMADSNKSQAHQAAQE
jgi:membrane protease YdiL (CAAX protease family)